MKKFLGVMCLALALIAFSNVATANPFVSGRPSDVHVTFGGGILTPFIEQIVDMQKQIHKEITDQIEALKKGKSLTALWSLLLVSLCYGIFHVLAPGHSKMVVGSYFLGNRADWREGVWAGLVMAAGHTITAVGVVAVLYFMFGFGDMKVLDKAQYMELVGYGLIALIGIWLLYRAVSGGAECGVCGHHHEHDHAHAHKHHNEPKSRLKKPSTGLFAAASLVPCTGSMIILLFTLANGVLWAGILAVLMVALGMWFTVTIIGLASMLLRQVIIGNEETLNPIRRGLIKASRVLAALVVMATGGLLFAGTLYSMMG